MRGKSFLYSIFSILLFIGVVFGIVFLFKFAIIAGIAGFVLLIFPELLRRKALREAGGILDKLLAKFIVPILFVVLAFLAIMSIAFWITM